MTAKQKRVIWMISASFYPAIGGGERQAQLQAKSLIACGWQVRVLTRRHLPDLKGDLPAYEVIESIPIHRMYSKAPGKFASVMFFLNSFLYLLRHGRRAVYHSHGTGTPAWLAICVHYLLGGRSIIKLRNSKDFYEENYTSWLAKRQFRWSLHLAGYIIALNQHTRQYAIDLGVPPERVVNIPNGLDTTFFHSPTKVEKMEAREKLKLPAKKIIVLNVGSMQWRKGKDILLRAWADLPARIRERAIIVFVGDGTERPAIEELIQQLGLEDSTLLVGAQQSILEYYWAADVFVLPSRVEGMSNALVEAMACELPSVATTVGNAPEIIQNGHNGYLTPPENPKELLHILQHLLENQQEWQALGKHARETVQDTASIHRTIQSLEALYTAGMRHAL